MKSFIRTVLSALILASAPLTLGGCAASSYAGVAAERQESPVWRPLPWLTTDVFRTIISHIEDPKSLDPNRISELLQAEKGLSSVLARIPAAFTSVVYSCTDNNFHLPDVYLKSLCAGSTTVNMYVYAQSSSGEPMGDTRRIGMTPTEQEALDYHLGKFLASASDRGLKIVDLTADPEFSRARLVHPPMPINDRLVLTDNASRLVIICSFKSQPNDPVGDKVISITIFQNT